MVITGVGLLSAWGSNEDVHLAALLDEKRPVADGVSFAPFHLVKAAPFDAEDFVPGRSDRRQMEPWQLLGVAAAKLALDSAGIPPGDERDSLCLNLAANGGGREHDMDLAVLDELLVRGDPQARLVESMSKRIRPSFLLGQLANLLAGNIAIVLGVGGGARTFMGEEHAGVEALEDAVSRITAGQSDRILVGGVLDADRAELMFTLAMGGLLHAGTMPAVLNPDRNGLCPGSMAAFVLVEAEEVAHARAVPPLARITGIKSAWTGGIDGQVALTRCISALPHDGDATLILSGASGIQPSTTEEWAALEGRTKDARILATADVAGHGLEASFPFAVALAALSIQAGAAGRVLTTTGSDRCSVAAALLEATV